MKNSEQVVVAAELDGSWNGDEYRGSERLD
ncbi:hypothetical protein FHR87_001457 [Azomonas macrocytogenes]|uniref:Uncharacterized protein n=1 Tax=Azomonas macrocytogenes TaxID=69962 RepID=A0A839T0Z8_AZOMA|nr:hypothetical protein [Azomonas macrocytogenes]